VEIIVFCTCVRLAQRLFLILTRNLYGVVVFVKNIMKNNTARILQIGIGLLAVVAPAFAGLTVTPEPTTVALLGGGLGVMILIARRRRSQK
jgi:hypothetical protein